MANWAATKLLQTALSTATNSSHVCQDVSTHLTLEHPSRFCWTAPSPSSFWHLQLYCNVLVCMIWFIPTTLCNHICLLLLIFDGLHVCCSFDFLFVVILQGNSGLPPCRYIIRKFGRLSRNCIIYGCVENLISK